MSFWSTPQLEPLRQHRWYILFSDTGLQTYSYALKDCSKPSYKIDISEHVLINHTFRFPKNLVWQPVSAKMVTARDSLDSILSGMFKNHLEANGYYIPTSPQTKQLNKSSMLENIELTQIDADGNPVETWILRNSMFTDVKFGSLSYENEGLVDIEFTITYDFAELEIKTINNPSIQRSPGFPTQEPV